LPGYEDEGFADGDYNTGVPWDSQADEPGWSFSNLPKRDNDSDDAASDMPALGSGAGDLGNRMMEDFGDEGYDQRPATPTNEDDVVDIRLVGDE
jgi:hypothetical protein